MYLSSLQNHMAASTSPLSTINSSSNSITTATATATTTCAFLPIRNQNHRKISHIMSCNSDQTHNISSSKNDGQPSTGKLDRRNMLIGLGGLYGVAGHASKQEEDEKSDIANAAEPPNKKTEVGEFPVTLNRVIRTVVPRPKKSRSKKEKEDEEEVLVIDGIELEKDMFVKFDVYVNDEDDPVSRPDNTEFAGSFVNVPHKHKHGNKTKTRLRLGLTDLLEGLDVDGDDTVVVTLVPRSGADDVTVGGIKIEFDG